MTKSGKHCGKRRNCSKRAISTFVTMFSKSRRLQRRQKASIWGKGLRQIYINIGHWIWFKSLWYNSISTFLYDKTNLMKNLIKILKITNKWKCNYLIELKIFLSNFHFCNNLFKSCLLKMPKNVTVFWKGTVLR